jgi:hypothetical protein
MSYGVRRQSEAATALWLILVLAIRTSSLARKLI